jgi:hypothetical protein
MPHLSTEERCEKVVNGLARARERDKLDAAAFGRLVTVACEIELRTLKIAARVLNGNHVNDALRIRAGLLADSAAKTIARLTDQALKLGLKAPVEEPEAPPVPEAPDLSE